MDISCRRQGLALLTSSVVTGSLFLSSSAHAQTGADLLLGSFGENQNYSMSLNGFFLQDGHVKEDDGDAQLMIYNSSGRWKLDLEGVIPGINRAQPRAGFNFTMVDLVDRDDAILPSQFMDASFGVGLGIAKGDRWQAGLSVAIGYASGSAFDDANAWYGKADLAVGYVLNEREKIGFVLDYNGNRTFMPDVPLPGVIYTRVISDQITVDVGFPYSEIVYKPDETWTFRLRYVIPDGGEAEVIYALNRNFGIYASFQQQNEAFHWDELENSNDRVLFSQTRAEVGIRTTYNDRFSFLLAGGYSFNTEFETGWDTRDTEKLAEISDEPYLRIGFELKF